jgi:hypothetical protein
MNENGGRDNIHRRGLWAGLWVQAVIATVLTFSSHGGAITNGTVDTVHTYVGAWIVQLDDGSYTWCSGSLVSSRVFLSAGHCAFFFFDLFGIPINKMWVSFATDILADRKSWRTVSDVIVHPDLSLLLGPLEINDIALVILSKPVKDIAPGKLAPVGYLDALEAAGALDGAAFASVGYGVNENFQVTSVRKVAYSGFVALYGSFLQTSKNPALGFGGACTSDSGGPKLYDDGKTEYIVATMNWGDSACQDLDMAYRVDTPGALEFIQRGILANP